MAVADASIVPPAVMETTVRPIAIKKTPLEE
jgi:hypothetical protein